ncbi:hypothetical protein B9Z55_023704 [Caenorhabditis nigoni]|uniref:Uncharacterized protein n=1 Tax=Caenorhabditis nigoni TaxID=1611254 RepID=A0A2G5SQU5_9PELO|nr:hypothetical protein B9Z55_023704 [Caenorhabditis nigoni]
MTYAYDNIHTGVGRTGGQLKFYSVAITLLNYLSHIFYYSHENSYKKGQDELKTILLVVLSPIPRREKFLFQQPQQLK